MEAPPNDRTKPWLVSIVINNYNYVRFLRQSVESALGQTYEHVETIVVDDGSTDNSREVLAEFGDRIRTVLKKNGGQGSTFNAGLLASRGDIVIYLDSDDYLYPFAAERIASRWEAGAAKLHYRLLTIDGEGKELGLHPREGVPLPTGEVWRSFLRDGTYVTPATSGNAFGRPALEKVLPMPEEGYLYAADVYLTVRIPFYGVMLAVDEALGVYRQHGSNDSLRSTLAADIGSIRGRMKREVFNDAALALEVQRLGCAVEPELRYIPYQRLKLRTLSWALDRAAHPIAADTRSKLAGLAWRAVWRRNRLSFYERLVQSMWFAVVLGLPTGVVLWLFRRAWLIKRIVKPGAKKKIRPDL